MAKTSETFRLSRPYPETMRFAGVLIISAFALFVGLIGGWFAGMLLTPTLWKLEGPLGMELAGHSGPSDWLLGTFSITGAILCWVIVYFGVLRKVR